MKKEEKLARLMKNMLKDRKRRDRRNHKCEEARRELNARLAGIRNIRNDPRYAPPRRRTGMGW